MEFSPTELLEASIDTTVLDEESNSNCSWEFFSDIELADYVQSRVPEPAQIPSDPDLNIEFRYFVSQFISRHKKNSNGDQHYVCGGALKKSDAGDLRLYHRCNDILGQRPSRP